MLDWLRRNPREDHSLQLGGRTVPIEIRRLAHARRLTLRLAMICSALTTLCLPFVTPEWSLLGITLLCIVAGITVTSWNGVQIAEIAQLAPSHQVHEASSGATLVLFVGYVAGPAGFALLTSLTGSIPFGLYVTSIIIRLRIVDPARQTARKASGWTRITASLRLADYRVTAPRSCRRRHR